MRIPLALFLVTTVSSAQAPRELSGYLPPITPVVVDLVDGAACVRTALDLVENLPKGIPPAARLFLMGLPVITKAATGMDVVDLLEVVTPSQAMFAMYPSGQGGEPFPVLLSRVTETGEVRRLLRRVDKGGNVHASVDAGVLTIADTRAHLRTVLQFRKSGKPTLFRDEDYRRGRAEMKPGRSVRFYMNVEVLRGKYAKAKSYWGQLDEGSRFLAGPIVRVFDLAKRVDGRLDITKTGFQLNGEANADLEQDPKQVGRLTAAGAKGRSIPVPPASALACVSLDRDIGELLHHPDRWLGEDGALGVKKSLSLADQLLGGASLLEDLLPNIDMPMTFFVTGSKPDEDADLPRIRLPSFTLVFALGDEDDVVEKLLNRAMGILVSITNVQRIQSKQTRIDVRTGGRDDYRFKYVRFGDWNASGDPPLEQGLSPTLLFAHGHGILASTIDGAVRMAETLKSGKTMKVMGDYIALRGAPIARVLADNLSVLVIDRVLKEGGTRKDSESFWKAVESVVRMLEFEGRVEPRTGSTRFSFGLTRVKEAKR